jgi:hypothetical protein
MYREGYGYKSGVNEMMVRHLQGIADYAAIRQVGRFVLDIGYNDGTLLRAWAPGVYRYGVDPIGVSVGPTATRASSPTTSAPKFKVITSIAMFYDLPDPVAFAEDVRNSLTDDGVWILEVQYAGAIQRGLWDGICHEHLTYYGLRQIAEVARRARLAHHRLLLQRRERRLDPSDLGKRATARVRSPEEGRWDWSDLQSMIELSAKNVGRPSTATGPTSSAPAPRGTRSSIWRGSTGTRSSARSSATRRRSGG